MTTAGKLVSSRVVVGSPEDRLADLAPKIAAVGAHHCVVVEAGQKFTGVIRMGDVATYAQAGNRILVDLISSIQPLVVRASEPAEAVTALFTQHRLYEAVVLEDTGEYVGLATAESVVEFLLAQSRRQAETLQQTQANLEAAANVKEIFLRSLSHELRTPLNPILLLASEGAANARLPTEVREQFEVIATNALLEAHLIDGLLDLTRASQGTIRLEQQLVDVRAVLSRAVNEMQTAALACDARIETDLEPEGAQVMGDAAKLEQAFRNLLRNSLDSIGPRGRVHVESRLAADGSNLTITFSDDGGGLTEAELVRTFDPFSRMDQAAAGSKGGGKIVLGLALAQAIISLHAGRIGVTSEGRGKGTTFKIELPLLAMRGADAARTASKMTSTRS